MNLKRRMLARSRTNTNENTNKLGDTAEILSRPTSLLLVDQSADHDHHALPSASNSRAVSPSKPRVLEDASAAEQSPRPLISNTNIRTYAGKSRSFLVALPSSHLASLPDATTSLLDDDEPVDAGAGNTQEDDFEMQESYADLRARWGVDNSEDDFIPEPLEEPSPNSKRKGKGKQVEQAAPLPNGMMNDLKSITELRSKGESRRFLDEVGYLFEGLDPKGAIGVRRGRYATKMHFSSGVVLIYSQCLGDGDEIVRYGLRA